MALNKTFFNYLLGKIFKSYIKKLNDKFFLVTIEEVIVFIFYMVIVKYTHVVGAGNEIEHKSI